MAGKLITVGEYKSANYKILHSYFIKNPYKVKTISLAYRKLLSSLIVFKFFFRKIYCGFLLMITEPIIFIYQIQLRSKGGLKGGYQFVRLVELRRIVKTYNPDNVLEFGSGASSLLFAKYCKLISLEEDLYWLDKYKSHLYKNFLIPQMLKKRLGESLYLALRVEKCLSGEPVATYESVLDWKSQEFDLVYIDGPTNWVRNPELNCSAKDPQGSLPCISVIELSKKPKVIVVDGRRATVAYLINSGAFESYGLYLKGVYSEHTKISPYHSIFTSCN